MFGWFIVFRLHLSTYLRSPNEKAVMSFPIGRLSDCTPYSTPLSRQPDPCYATRHGPMLGTRPCARAPENQDPQLDEAGASISMSVCLSRFWVPFCVQAPVRS